MIEAAGHRPLALLRCPNGIEGDCFFQKHPGKGWPDDLDRIEVTEKTVRPLITSVPPTPKPWSPLPGWARPSFTSGARGQTGSRGRTAWSLTLVSDEGLDWPDVRDAVVDLRDRLGDLPLA